MTKHLIPEWKHVLLYSYSAWSMYLGIISLNFPDIFYTYTQRDLDPAIFSIAGNILLFFGIFGRIFKQSSVSRYLATLLIASMLVAAPVAPTSAMSQVQVQTVKAEPTLHQTVDEFMKYAFPLIAKWEGLRNHSYRDIVGVWTICYGHTRTAGPDQYMSDDQCTKLLEDEIKEYQHELRQYFSVETRVHRLPPWRDAAYTSLAFNVGWAGAGKSTAVRRLNAGDIMGGCEALTWWNKAGQRVVRGLVARRSEERDMCLIGT